MEQIDEVKDQKVYYNLQTSGNIKLEPSNDENTTTKDNKCVQFTGNINIATVQFHHIKAEPENKDAKQEISALDCEKDSVPVCGVEETTVKVGPPQEEFVNGISFVAPEGFYGQSEVKQEQINMNDDVLDYVESDPLNVSELNQFIEGKIGLFICQALLCNSVCHY